MKEQKWMLDSSFLSSLIFFPGGRLKCIGSSLTAHYVMIFQQENWWGGGRGGITSYHFMRICWLNAPETAQRYIFGKQAVLRVCTEEVQRLCGLIWCFATELQQLEDLLLAKVPTAVGKKWPEPRLPQEQPASLQRSHGCTQRGCSTLSAEQVP